MALKIGVVSQKGGVGKSTLARAIACEYAAGGWNVKLADMDKGQGTSHSWHARRLAHELSPELSVERFNRVERVLRVEDQFNLIVFDGSPRASNETKQIAKVCDLVVLPTGVSVDDMEPTVLLAYQLKSSGVPVDRIVFALSRVGDSKIELEEAKSYLNESGYYLLGGHLPELTGYRRASDTGRSVTETAYTPLNDRAAELVQSIMDRVQTTQED